MRYLACVTPGKFEYRSGDIPRLTTGNTLLKITRIGICGTDLHAFEGTQPFFNYPRVLGHELSAIVADAGGATDFSTGERVTFIPYFSCGECVACRQGKPNCCVKINVCGVHSDGGMAEYLSVPSSSLVHGEGLDDDALALIEPLAIGAHGIRRAEVKPREFVLVVGAGPIGLGTMEFARITGAEVIAMDVNNARLKFCREKLGVKHTVNGSAATAMDEILTITHGDMPSVVIDATGNQAAINSSFRYLAHGGRYVLIGLQKGDVHFSHPEFHKREATLMSSRNATRTDFDQVISSMKSGQVRPSDFITHRVSFDQIADEFPKWLIPENGVIKAMVNM